MRRAVISLAALAAFAASGYNFYHFGLDQPYYSQPSLWLILGPTVVLLVIAIVLTAWALSDNIYNVKSGEVIDHHFTDAHYVAGVYVPGSPGVGTSPGTPGVYVPGHWEPDDWAIQIRDARGRAGWLHFSTNVFNEHPIGSFYDPQQG